MNVQLAGRMRRSANRARQVQEEKRPIATWFNNLSPRLEQLLEDHGSSSPAYFLAVFVVLCIFASTCSFCLETLPELAGYTTFWFYLESFFIAIFTLEYVTRLAVTSKPKLQFMSETMNFIDLLSLLPFYITACFGESVTVDLRWMRCVRLMRIFKLGRHSQDLQFIFEGIAGSTTSFILLGFLLLLALVFFSFLLYIFEQGAWDSERECYVRKGEVHYTGCSPYQNVPAAFWWAITTLTTVGYGDAFPLTSTGRGVCGVAMVCGILCVALPTTQLGVEFANLYKSGKADRQERNARRAMMHCNKVELEFLTQVKKLQRLQASLGTQAPYVRQLVQVVAVKDPRKLGRFGPAGLKGTNLLGGVPSNTNSNSYYGSTGTGSAAVPPSPGAGSGTPDIRSQLSPPPGPAFSQSGSNVANREAATVAKLMKQVDLTMTDYKDFLMDHVSGGKLAGML